MCVNFVVDHSAHCMQWYVKSCILSSFFYCAFTLDISHFFYSNVCVAVDNFTSIAVV